MNKSVDNYQGKKFYNNKVVLVDDYLTLEQALKIQINNQPFTVTMRTPGDDLDLVRGLLYSEDIYKGNHPLEILLTENEEKNITEASIIIEDHLLGDGYMNSRNILSVSSCGICGKKELDDIDFSKKIVNKKSLRLNDLFNMFQMMKQKQTTFHQSGGSHAAGIFVETGNLLVVREDIGRHNAVDKVIGSLIDQNQLKKAYCLTVSGRISYEIIIKAFAAKIPILAAVSAPSTLAVDFAKELGITLLGFCREEKATCYSHPYRIQE